MAQGDDEAERVASTFSDADRLLEAGDPAGWQRMQEAWGVLLSWDVATGRLSDAAKRVLVDGAQRFESATASELFGPHALPSLLRPAIEAARSCPELAAWETRLVTDLARRHIDFGELRQARALLTREFLERARRSPTRGLGRCLIAAAILARLDADGTNAAALLDEAERLPRAAGGGEELRCEVLSERVAGALYDGRIEVAFVALAELENCLGKVDPRSLAAHALRVHGINLRLATGRVASVTQRATEGVGAARARAAAKGIQGRALWRTNSLVARYQLLGGKAALHGGQLDKALDSLSAALAPKSVGAGRAEAGLGGVETVEALLCLAQAYSIKGAAAEAVAALDRAAAALEASLAPGGSPGNLGWSLTPRLTATRALVDQQRGAPVETLAAHRGPVAAALDAMMAAWSRTELRPGGIGFLHHEERRFVLEQAIEIELAIDAKSGPACAFLHVLKAQAHGTMARRLGAPPVDIANALRIAAGPNGGGLCLVPGRFRSHLFILDRSGVTHHSLAPLSKIQGPRGELVRALQRRLPRSEVMQAASRLTEVLLPMDVRRRVAAWKSVTVIGADLLDRAPFELLLLESGVPLGLSLPVTHLPSMSVGAILQQRRASRNTPADYAALALVAPAFGRSMIERFGVKRLTHGAAHVAALRTVFPKSLGKLTAASGRGATLEALKERRWCALHILTHGVQRIDQERRGALLMAGEGEDQLLTAAVFESIWASGGAPGIVTLGVCGGGAGATRFGDDAVEHLGGTLLEVGADVVILSGLRIDEVPTMRLFEHFYDALEDPSIGPATALLRARLEMASGRDGFDHPADWGLLKCLGLGHQPVER